MADEDEEDTAFVEKFNKLFHRAMGERETRFEKRLMGKIDETLGSRFDSLRQILVDSDPDDADVTSEESEVSDETHGQPTQQQPIARQGISPELRARMLRNEREVKEAKERAERFERQYNEAETKRSRAEERQALLSAVQPYVKPKLLDMVVNQLHSGNIVRDEESGAILWKNDDGTTLPLKDGAQTWAKSDVGKEFAPPVEARGRGGRGPGDSGAVQPGKFTIENLGDVVTGSIPGQKH